MVRRRFIAVLIGAAALAAGTGAVVAATNVGSISTDTRIASTTDTALSVGDFATTYVSGDPVRTEDEAIAIALGDAVTVTSATRAVAIRSTRDVVGEVYLTGEGVPGSDVWLVGVEGEISNSHGLSDLSFDHAVFTIDASNGSILGVAADDGPLTESFDRAPTD